MAYVIYRYKIAISQNTFSSVLRQKLKFKNVFVFVFLKARQHCSFNWLIHDLCNLICGLRFFECSKNNNS